MPVCKACGETKGLIELRDGKCRPCRDKEAEQIKAEELERERALIAKNRTADVSTEVIDAQAKSILLTMGLEVPGRETVEIVQIVAAEAALGMNLFRDIANNWRDTLGGRSGSVQTILKDAREACLLELKREAFRAGADAVIAVRLNYSEASTSAGTGGGILFVAASGTAVKLA